MKLSKICCAGFALVLGLSLMGSVTYSPPAAAQNVMQEAEARGISQQRVALIYQPLMAQFDEIFVLDELIEEIRAGAVGTEEGGQQAHQMIAEIRSSISQSGEQLAGLEYPEGLSNRDAQMMEDTRAYLHKLKGQIEDYLAGEVTYLEDVLAGRPINDNQLIKKNFFKMIVILEGENELMAGNLSSVQDNHPEHTFGKAIMGGNSFLISVFESAVDWVDQDISDRDFQSQVDGSVARLDQLKKLIEKGDQQVAVWIRMINLDTRADPDYKTALTDIMNSYGSSFDNEFLIANHLAKMGDSLKVLVQDQSALEQYDLLSLELQGLIDARMNGIMERTSMIASINQ